MPIYLYNIHSLGNSTKYSVLVVQPWSSHCGYKELRTICILARICHWYCERPIMPQTATEIKNHLLLVPSEAKPYQEVSTCHRHIPQLIISLECEIMIFLAYSNRTFVDKLHYLLWNSSSNSLPQIDCPPVPSPKGSPVCIMKPLMTLWKIRLS